MDVFKDLKKKNIGLKRLDKEKYEIKEKKIKTLSENKPKRGTSEWNEYIRRKRILKDINDFKESNVKNVYIDFNEEKIDSFKFLIIGTKETPYYNGFFIFKLTFPKNYPFSPPDLKFISTDNRIRFHPNLYADGKVCMSLINTWDGEQWSACQSVMSVICSIQTAMDSFPIIHEPGHEKDSMKKKNYLIKC